MHAFPLQFSALGAKRHCSISAAIWMWPVMEYPLPLPFGPLDACMRALAAICEHNYATTYPDHESREDRCADGPRPGAGRAGAVGNRHELGRVPYLNLKDHCLHVSLFHHGSGTLEAHFEEVSQLAPIYRSLPVASILSH